MCSPDVGDGDKDERLYPSMCDLVRAVMVQLRRIQPSCALSLGCCPDRRTYSMSDWLQDKNENRVLELLLESETQRPPSSALWKLRNLHSSCLNDYANMKTAGRKMVQIISRC